MSEHTPGPWVINNADGRLPDVREVKMPHGEASTYVASIKGANGHILRLDFGYGTKSDASDARLIAAAPDLLAALKIAVRLLEAFEIGVDKEIRAAIAKAEGR